MKKVSLLAASVAIALSGCGGSDGGSSGGATPGGIVITGFDGYFKNAVVFDDVGQRGVLEVGTDTIFGLTDKEGKITLPVDTEIDGKLAIKTLRPGDMTKALAEELSALSPEVDTYSDFMDIYTTDMDHEGQPMANSVVFRTPEGTDKTALVISPITDLVAIEMQNGASLEQATSTVNENLGGSEEAPIDLFSDFVVDADTNLESAQLHKTAQILTESKAQNPVAYENNANSITETASETSKEIVTEENMGTDELLNEKPVIDPTQPEAIVTNYKLLVNAEAEKEFADKIAKLEVTEGVGFTHTISIPDNLFQDKYSAEGQYENVTAHTATINGAQEITATLEGNMLTLTAANDFVPTLSHYIITLTAEDRAESNSPEALSELSTTFSFDVSLANTAPSLNTDVQADLQENSIDKWSLKQGEQFSAELEVNGLFSDREGDVLTYDSNISNVVKGLTSKHDSATGKMTISGSPEAPTSEIKQFTITADDGHAATFMVSEPAAFDLPLIEVGDITVDTAVKAVLQETVTDTWSFKVGESTTHQLDISKLFTSNVAGDTEYYAHYAANDNEPASNPIPGVTVNVDAGGLVTLEGTPTSETNGVMLYVAKGINFSGADENDIESEIVTFALPNVQPSDEVEPPAPELGFTEAHFNNQEWKMGSFADNDGEIGYASLDKDEHGLMFCWGSTNNNYKQNISVGSHNYNYTPFVYLSMLDKESGYLESQNKDCWDVEIVDGKLIDKEGMTYEMLYQNTPATGEYQIIVKIDGDELFWLDSTATPFAQTLPASEHIQPNTVDFDLMVESEYQDDSNEPLLTYAAGKFEYNNDSYKYTSIKPLGFYTPGNMNFVVDEFDREAVELEETGIMSDEKTRYRYILRDFGDFYIGVKWSEEFDPDYHHVSPPEFGLYSYTQESMEKVIDQLPLVQD